MKVNVMVLDELAHEGTGRRGKFEIHKLVVVDQDRECMLLNTFDYVMSAEEFAKHGQKQLVGKPVLLGVKEIVSGFGGRIQARGRIVSVNGGGEL